MTEQEAIRLIRILPTMCVFTDAYGEPIDSDAYYEAVDMVSSALQAQDSKTRRICKTCKHYPSKMDKWPCVDCDMREPANRWESQDVPDTNDGDLISRQRVIDELKRYFHDEYYQRTSIQNCIDCFIEDILIKLPSAQPETAKRIVGKSRDGMTFWYQCDMCNEPVDAQDNFCRGCGRRLTDG